MTEAASVLIVLDGWGHRSTTASNAIAHAKTPVWDDLWHNRPHTLISGSGTDVGLPPGQMGNSEVGHMNLGAGRIVHQDLTRITLAIETGDFFTNPVLNRAASACAERGTTLHILGLLSPGGVHSHEDQIRAMVDLAVQCGVKRVLVHAFLDGRDVPPKSATRSLETMQQHIASQVDGGVATICGRYFAMDRDNRWDRVASAYRLLAHNDATHAANDVTQALANAYARGESDEFVQPTVIIDAPMANGDGVVFMNFRADRAREITRAFVDPDFDKFDRGTSPDLSGFTTLTEYAANIDAPSAFAPETLSNTLGEFVAATGRTQLRIAETEKYAHVTFFLSGGREEAFPGEARELIPSPDVATYDLMPEMSAGGVTDRLIAAISNHQYDVIVCNFANGDMVGHTGNFDAAVEAVQCLDHCIGRVVAAVNESGSQCLITADHGNVEQMSDPVTGEPHTAHTSELVPLIYVGPQALDLTGDGCLRDVAPTLLTLMGLAPPAEMTGRSLAQMTPVKAHEG